MNNTVVWLPDAEARLTTLWLGSRHRLAMTEAADRMEATLKLRPQGAGEPRPDDIRILLDWPLGITYRIVEADRRVVVLDVWQM